MRRWGIAGILVFAAGLALGQQPVAAPAAEKSVGDKPPAAPAEDAAVPVFLENVRLVNVFANVTDGTGAIIGGLTKEDFAVSEDGRAQRIAVFERQSELPLNLVLAVDTSGSVKKDLSAEEQAAKRFVHALLRGQDRMALLQFADEVREVVGFTNQTSRLDKGLGALKTGNSTAFYDAVYLAAQNLAGKQGRKVLVVITDGGDTAKNTSYAQALEAALRSEVMVYSLIDVPVEASAGRELGGEHALIALSEQTGGRYFYVDEGGLDKAFERVSEDLRTQYLLGYYPARQDPGASFHRIRVTVPRAAEEQFQIHARTGYYSDGDAGK